MDLREIIDEIASQADDLLANANDRRETEAAVTEVIESDYPDLSEKSRRVVLAGVMLILEEEDFFAGVSSADSWADDDESDTDD